MLRTTAGGAAGSAGLRAATGNVSICAGRGISTFKKKGKGNVATFRPLVVLPARR
jgi:hypothetical protein